jgi:hypothetical protein
MAIYASITDRQWCDAKSDGELAQFIAGLAPRAADGAIRDLNAVYRSGTGANFGLDPVNMIAINPVGELLDASYLAVAGARSPLTAAEIEPVVTWIRAHRTAA